MTRTRTTDTWALYVLTSMCIGLAIRYLVFPGLWDGLGEVWTVLISPGMVQTAKTIGLSEGLIMTISNHVSPLLIPGTIGIVSAKTAVTILQKTVATLQNVGTFFRELIGQ